MLFLKLRKAAREKYKIPVFRVQKVRRVNLMNTIIYFF